MQGQDQDRNRARFSTRQAGHVRNAPLPSRPGPAGLRGRGGRYGVAAAPSRPALVVAGSGSCTKECDYCCKCHCLAGTGSCECEYFINVSEVLVHVSTAICLASFPSQRDHGLWVQFIGIGSPVIPCRTNKAQVIIRLGNSGVCVSRTNATPT